MKTLITILTYNRLNLLKRCINSIFSQTYQNFDLLIINNGSDDGTQEFLLGRNISHINLSKGGSAQGWYQCFESGIKGNYDFIWMMDDDGYSDKNALQNLLNHIDNSACISSVLVSELNNQRLVFPLKRNNLEKKTIKFYKDFKNEYFNYVHFFNGCLINLKKIKYQNLIDKNLYHHGVEVDFLNKIKKYGSVLTYKNSIHYHPDVNKRKVNELWIYYYLRNTIILNSKLSKKKSIFFSTLYLINTLKFILLRNGIIDFFSYLLGRNNRIIYKAFFDGINLRLKNIVT